VVSRMLEGHASIVCSSPRSSSKQNLPRLFLSHLCTSHRTLSMTRALASTPHSSSGAPFSFVPPNRYRRPLYNPTLVPAPPKGFIIHKGIESASPIPFHSLAPAPKIERGRCQTGCKEIWNANAQGSLNDPVRSPFEAPSPF
jgi:hypothetical protein